MCEAYYLVPEITKNGNIHYHAIANFKDGNSRMMATLLCDMVKPNKYIGNTKVNDCQVAIEDYGRTVEYLFKEYKTTLKMINFNGFRKDPSEIEIFYASGVNKKESDHRTISLSKLCVCLGDGDEEQPLV